MKYTFIFTLLMTCLLISNSWAQQGYEIKVKIKDYDQDTVILGYRMGAKTFVKDTMVGKDSKGYFVSNADTTLPGGVYLILTRPNNLFFEFLIPNDKEQQLTLTTKAEGNDLTKNLKIEGSSDNAIFLDYLGHLRKMNEKSETWQKRIPEIRKILTTETNPPKKAELEKELKDLESKMSNISKEVKAYQDEMCGKHPNSLSCKLVLAAQQPEVPKTITDRTQQYYYFKHHYWENFDFGDMRLIRTPLFETKMDFYTDKLTPQDPDSVIVSVDYILGEVKKAGDKDMWKFALAHLLNKYAKSKVICMDKVYVHIGKKYYCGAEKPEWMDPDQLEKICNNVADLQYALCGMKAQPLNLTDIKTNVPIELYSIDSRFVLVYFWDPSCGNCTKTTKKLMPVYSKWKGKGLEIYGVCSENINNVDKCKKKIDDLKITWINTTDQPRPLAYAKKFYDVKVNPFIYMLDKDKKIMYKRLDPEQVDNILEREINGIQQPPIKEK